jgi:hypothetical protein
MVEIFWTVITLCGLAIIAYGIFLFLALPAAGLLVAMIGIVITIASLRKIDLLTARFTALIRKRTKFKTVAGSEKLRRQFEPHGKKLPIRFSYKVVAFLFFGTSVYVVSGIIPKFSSLGDEIGFLASAALGIVGALFYTGLILSVFRTSMSLAVVLLIPWAAIVLATANSGL